MRVVLHRRHVVLIECLPSTQDAWIAFALRCGRHPGEVLCGVEHGRNPTGVPIGRYGDLPPLPQNTAH